MSTMNWLNLGFFKNKVAESDKGITNGIRWQHQNIFNSLLYFGIHAITLDIPNQYLTLGTLNLGFEALTVENFPKVTDFGGLADLKIIACRG